MNREGLGQAIAEMLGGDLDPRIGGHITDVVYRVNRPGGTVWLKIDAADYQDLRPNNDHLPIAQLLVKLRFGESANRGGHFVLTGGKLIRQMGDDEAGDAEL